MNLSNRLSKLERVAEPAKLEWGEEVAKKQDACDQPPSMGVIYREYGFSRMYRDLVCKFHCNNCGHEDYLWDWWTIGEEEMFRFYDLLDSDYHAFQQYGAELVDSGKCEQMAFPPPEYVQVQFLGCVKFREGERHESVQ